MLTSVDVVQTEVANKTRGWLCTNGRNRKYANHYLPKVRCKSSHNKFSLVRLFTLLFFDDIRLLLILDFFSFIPIFSYTFDYSLFVLSDPSHLVNICHPSDCKSLSLSFSIRFERNVFVQVFLLSWKCIPSVFRQWNQYQVYS